ncbi:hypothetical protein PR003_g34463 [Phytophthora rubi]|uniref:Secreted protein n=1 Tax=Phytophthora rubi TaxID=129364 RepID=A0A6A3G4Y4_9STRA|nr:hypothetical protein PR001_g33350 [Phytophthora rubi]KAE8953594.1 hypothetical protein PR002_g32331 [Phytophthora rubi]KAE9260218.1 hypothetical protein PR003_g34463 [Phytophthora rubi]
MPPSVMISWAPRLLVLNNFCICASCCCCCRISSSVSCPVAAAAVAAGGAVPVLALSVCSLPTTWRTGARDNASATTFVEPGRYVMSKLYSCSCNAQRCSRPARSFLRINQLSAE